MLNSASIQNSEFLDQADPTLASGFYDETKFIAVVGLVYDYSTFQFGLSAPSLVIGGEALSEHIVGTASYKYNIENSDFSVTPLVIYQNLPVIDNRFDVLLKGEYKKKIWAQVGYQSTNNLNFGLGFDLGPLGIGYAYEMNNSEFSDISSNSNEIVVRISFLPLKQAEKNATISMLDEYAETFKKMLADQNNNYSKVQVVAEIQKMQIELGNLQEQNDQKTAKSVEKRLTLLENKIVELEKKYIK